MKENKEGPPKRLSKRAVDFVVVGYKDSSGYTHFLAVHTCTWIDGT
jgi:hypothetical protein